MNQTQLNVWIHFWALEDFDAFGQSQEQQSRFPSFLACNLN